MYSGECFCFGQCFTKQSQIRMAISGDIKITKKQVKYRPFTSQSLSFVQIKFAEVFF